MQKKERENKDIETLLAQKSEWRENIEKKTL